MKLNLFIVMTLAYSDATFADEQKRVDFTQQIVVDGKPLIDDFKCPEKDGKRPCETPMTVGELAFLSLERPVQSQSWADAIKRDDLAKAVRSAKEFPLLNEQLATIENAMGPLWSAGVLGAVAAVIDPKASK